MARHVEHPLNGQLQAERDRIEAKYLKRFEEVYAAVLQKIAADAARRFQRASWGRPIIAAGEWQPPHPDEVYPADAGEDIDKAAQTVRAEMWADMAGGLGDALGI